MSEAPQILAMQPLAGFVKSVGRAIDQQELRIYLDRLQEQGWDVRNTLRKAMACGAQLQDQVRNQCSWGARCWALIMNEKWPLKAPHFLCR